jgi:hypothetical protein
MCVPCYPYSTVHCLVICTYQPLVAAPSLSHSLPSVNACLLSDTLEESSISPSTFDLNLIIRHIINSLGLVASFIC